MHQPRPHGLSVVGGELSAEDSAAVELLARRLTNLKTRSGVDSLRMVRTLPDGGYAIAQDAGGVFKVIAHKPMAEPREAFEGVATDYIPMLFSGVITRAIAAPDGGVGMELTEQCRKRLVNYDPKADLPIKQQTLRRFIADYNQIVAELRPQYAGEAVFTQYVQQRPTWYSGAMAEVMQVVGGYGRQDLEALPDDPVERARMVIPERYLERIKTQIGNVRLPGYTGIPAKDGKFQYDYKHSNTHGVGFDTTGKPWLLNVRQSGVWAMPLPLVPATTTEAFREYVDEKGDQELIELLDRFGGMPSGESFPEKENDLEAWRRAGVAIKVCPAADFYDHLAFASTCGWSFNTSGTEGYNTCYEYVDGLGMGYGYKLKLNLSPAKDDGKLPPQTRQEDPVRASMLDRYLSSLFNQLDNSNPEHVAIKYKLRRVDPDDILARANGGDADAGEIDYWNGVELQPIAGHSGSMTRVSTGSLCFNALSVYVQPQMKFPEPFMGGCVSHDFLPLDEARGRDSYPNCDTVMFGYYVGDDLKVVKFFREGREYQEAMESDYEDCMTVGSWTQTESSGNTSIVGHFYTSDFDDRDTIAPVEKVTKIVGKDMGFDSQPYFGYDAPFWRAGDLFRNRYFSRRTTTRETTSRSFSVACCVPYLCRNELFHAYQDQTGIVRTTEKTSRHAVRDPTSYRYWTYHFVWAWAGGLDVENGKPFPEDGNPVWVEIEQYNPYDCSDFADQGPWIDGLPADYTWLIHPDANSFPFSGGGGPPSFKPYSASDRTESTDGGRLHFSDFDGPQEIHRRKPSSGYFDNSPNFFGNVFYADAARITFGQSKYASVDEKESGLRKRWGYTSLADHKSAHHFIGVINE